MPALMTRNIGGVGGDLVSDDALLHVFPPQEGRMLLNAVVCSRIRETCYSSQALILKDITCNLAKCGASKCEHFSASRNSWGAPLARWRSRPARLTARALRPLV